ncbi:MAG: TetR/AcrR family transcriptional regulator [Lysobacteraceae bacterium]
MMSAVVSRSAGPGRPKDPEKRAAILDAAKRLFLERSYDGVSMDAIAGEAGVSKLTVYSHFKDKETLFEAAVQAKCEEQMPARLFRPGTPDEDIGERLKRIARSFHGLATSPESIELFRVMAAQAQTNPEMAQRFYEAGPRRTLTEMEAVFRDAMARGQLEMEDPQRSAGHFFCLLKGEMHMRRLIGCCQTIDQKECDDHIDSVVRLFLRAYLPRNSADQAG